MRILPQDLAERWHLDLIRNRTLPGINNRGIRAAVPPSDKPLGPLGRLWIKDSPVPPERAAKALRSMPQKIMLPLVGAFQTTFVGGMMTLALLSGNADALAAFLVMGGGADRLRTVRDAGAADQLPKPPRATRLDGRDRRAPGALQRRSRARVLAPRP